MLQPVICCCWVFEIHWRYSVVSFSSSNMDQNVGGTNKLMQLTIPPWDKSKGNFRPTLLYSLHCSFAPTIFLHKATYVEHRGCGVAKGGKWNAEKNTLYCISTGGCLYYFMLHFNIQPSFCSDVISPLVHCMASLWEYYSTPAGHMMKASFCSVFTPKVSCVIGTQLNTSLISWMQRIHTCCTEKSFDFMWHHYKTFE